MARPRTPTAILELRGSFKNRPSRRRDAEPKPNGPLGPPPERLPADVIPCWLEIEESAPAGVLGASDRWCVELASRFMTNLRNGTSNATELRLLRSLLGALGMTPADRARLSVSPEKPGNRFTELAMGPM